jgi:hypothetical protein
MRAALLLLAALAAFAEPRPPFVHAVEFPYYAYPHALWERELVWLRNIGIRTVAFSVPGKWHEPRSGVFDFSGATAPRRDLAGLLRLLRRLDMRAMVRGAPPSEARDVLARGLLIAASSGKVEEVGVLAPDALVRSRRALTQGAAAIVWREVEAQVTPAGWDTTPDATFRRGAVSMSGEESAATAALRRNAALLQRWAAVLPGMRRVPVSVSKGALPRGAAASQFLPADANGPSAVSVTNGGDAVFEGELRVLFPGLNRRIALPKITLPPRGALWLPVRVPLSDPRLCRNCSVFANTDYLAYATAELHFLEYENGILAMEFAAPSAGEAVLQLSRQPNGPFLAAGHPAPFDWDAGTMRARLTIPAGRGLGARVRISLAVDAPEASGFLKDLNRLLIGVPNTVTASFSSEELAGRSRLVAPAGFLIKQIAQDSAEITYRIGAPADAVHGEFAELALEADGVTMGRARVPLLYPATVRLPQPIRLHAGAAEIPADRTILPVDPRGGRNVEITIRNHSNEIRTVAVAAEGAGLEFFPSKAEISLGPVMERVLSLRVFASAPGLHSARIRMTGGAEADTPVELLALPRDQTLAWQADLDGDGIAEQILENQRARAVFSTAGGRWLEFVWKDSNSNVLPESGALPGTDRVSIDAAKEELRFRGAGWTRTVRLDPAEARLTIDQTAALPAVASAAPASLRFETAAQAPGKAVYTIRTAR